MYTQSEGLDFYFEVVMNVSIFKSGISEEQKIIHILNWEIVFSFLLE